MKRPILPKISMLNLIAYSIFGLSLVILGSIVYFVWKIDVLKDWRLAVDQSEVRVGETLAVRSLYTKLINASGTATRYIECESEPGVYVAYPVNEATADRPAGKTGTGILLGIPPRIPDLPATCRVRININYKVLPFRTVHEVNVSNTFRVLPAGPAVMSASESANVSAPQSTVFQDQASSQSVSSPQLTPPGLSAQPDMSQEPQNAAQSTSPATEPEEDTGLIDSLLKIVKGLL